MSPDGPNKSTATFVGKFNVGLRLFAYSLLYSHPCRSVTLLLNALAELTPGLTFGFHAAQRQYG
jgi:hypothetical protein